MGRPLGTDPPRLTTCCKCHTLQSMNTAAVHSRILIYRVDADCLYLERTDSHSDLFR